MSEVWRGSTSAEMWAEIVALRTALRAALRMHQVQYDRANRLQAEIAAVPVEED